MRKLLAERARRRIEGLKLYEPMDHQQAIHASMAMERLIRGSNRSGKSLSVACEVARAVTGQDPFNKYPANDGIAVLVGKDGKHLGNVMYPYLFKSGSYRIIRDEKTGAWRAWKPWLPKDRKREKETRAAPPLIPDRFVKEVGWENKKENIPNLVRLNNGWVLNFYSSLGKPPQGSRADLAWFDEEIVDQEWYPEIAARLTDRKGRFIWSATPQAGTAQMYDLHEKCENEKGKPNPSCEEFLLLLEANQFMSEDRKKAFIDKIGSAEEYRVRIQGEFAFTNFKVYPEFSMFVQGVDYFEIPPHWTRYVGVDPGRQVCACLFLAVPPPKDPEHGGRVFLYDEIYIRNADAAQFGMAMQAKCRGQEFESFIIDPNWSKVTETGSGITVQYQYAQELRKRGVRSRLTGHGFFPGDDNVNAGIEKVRNWLRINDGGDTYLKVLRSKCRNFENEMMRYHYARVSGKITEKVAKMDDHCADVIRYLALYNPRHVLPNAAPKPITGAAKAYRSAMEWAAKRSNTSGAIRLGPGVTRSR